MTAADTLEHAPKTSDMNIDGPFLDVHSRTPDAFDHLTATIGPAWIGHEQLEQSVLRRAYVKRLIAKVHAVTESIHRKAVDLRGA